MSDAAANLPQEIITDILLRLPVKSIGKSRCVSKAWRSMLTSPQFIEAHLARHTKQKLLLLSSSHSLFTLTLNPTFCVSSKLKSFEENSDTLVGSCSGLVLVVTEEKGLILINPTTLEYAKLPNSPLALDPLASFSMHGFGYDSLSDDYKIVTLSYYDTDNEHEPDCADTFVDVYSVKMRSWRRLGSSPYDHAVPGLASGVCVNGSLHWMGSDGSSVIAAFDLGSEKFEEIPPPASLDKEKFVFNKLVVLKGCLGIVVELYNDKMVEVWFMNNYGLAESWTKLTIDVASVSWSKPLYFCRDELLILVEDDQNLMLYYPEDGKWDDLTVNGGKDQFEDGVTFSESLVSPHFNPHS